MKTLTLIHEEELDWNTSVAYFAAELPSESMDIYQIFFFDITYNPISEFVDGLRIEKGITGDYDYKSTFTLEVPIHNLLNNIINQFDFYLRLAWPDQQ